MLFSPPLIFPHYTFRMQRVGGAIRIWDSLRCQWLFLTPEEWVRQHMIRYLIEACGVIPQYIVQEYRVLVGRLAQRADIVVMHKKGTPYLLVECKAPDVALNHAVLSQAVRYNSVLSAPYLMLTNGRQLFCYRWEQGQYIPCADLPDLAHLDRID